MIKMKFIFVILIVLTVCCCATPLQADQHSPPWADNYDFLYPPLYGSMDTRPAGYNASYHQNSMGYDVSWNFNSSADEAYLILPDDSIFSFHGHGNNYQLLFWNGTGSSLIQTSVFGGRNPSVYYLDDFNDGELNDILFMLFNSCVTAESNASYGNFVTKSRSKGVDNAMGFSKEINNAKSIYWNARFWYWCDTDWNIYEAASAAKTETFYTSPLGYGGTDSWVLNGSWQTKIEPARYGN